MGNQIICENFEQFCEACYRLTAQGAVFKAYGLTLEIYITGF